MKMKMKMKMEKNNIMILYSRLRFHWVFACIMISTIACKKSDPATPYDPGMIPDPRPLESGFTKVLRRMLPVTK